MYEKKYKKYSLTLLTPSKAGFMIKTWQGEPTVKDSGSQRFDFHAWMSCTVLGENGLKGSNPMYGLRKSIL